MEQLGFLEEETITDDVVDPTEEKRTEIVDLYLKIIEEKNALPVYADFEAYDINRDRIRRYCTSITKLHDYVFENHAEKLSEFILHHHEVINEENEKKTIEISKKYKRFLITTAVNGKAVHQELYRSIKNYCEKTNTKLLIFPIEDISKTNGKEYFTLDTSLRDEDYVFFNLKLNENVTISDVKITARQILPLTGMQRFAKPNQVFIFAAPKQFLEYNPNISNPSALLTTGAITVNDYTSTKYIQKRTTFIAEQDHTLGGVIVEIENEKISHFRHFQANEDGSFVDLDQKYNPDGTQEQVEVSLILGDWHSGQTDPELKESLKSFSEQVSVNQVFLHDFFDGASINHHEEYKPIKKAQLAMQDRHSLEKEIKYAAKDLKYLSNLFPYLILIRSNHDEFLDRYLFEARYVQDPINHYFALHCAIALMENKNPLEWAIQKYINKEIKDKIVFLERDESFILGDIECGQHGDLGANGAKGTPTSLEKALGKSVTGHAHTAMIRRNFFRVGTSTKLKLDYNRGPSSWTQTAALVYVDPETEISTCQLINFKNNKWFLDRSINPLT